jgi:hypothetical protein
MEGDDGEYRWAYEHMHLMLTRHLAIETDQGDVPIWKEKPS